MELDFLPGLEPAAPANSRLRLRMAAESPTGGRGIISNDGAPVLVAEDENPGRPRLVIRNESPAREQRPATLTPPQGTAFHFRVQCFLRSLSPARRAEIAQRPRFRNQPWLRLADEPDDDPLP